MPIWLQIILGISASLIAIFGAYISYKQWKLSAYKLKHDLFERRWAIYASAHDLIADTLNGSKDERAKSYRDLQQKIITAQFLFPKDVCDYLSQLLEDIWKYNLLEQKIKTEREDREALEIEHAERYKHIENQAKVLAAKLKKYMELSI